MTKGQRAAGSTAARAWRVSKRHRSYKLLPRLQQEVHPQAALDALPEDPPK